MIMSNQSVAPDGTTKDEARMDDASTTPEALAPGGSTDSPAIQSPDQPVDRAINQPPGRPARRRGLPLPRAPRLVIASAALLVCALVLLMTGGRGTGTTPSSARAHPTATLTPTATRSPFPTPTAELGFKVYLDRSERFFMQYPLMWEAKQTNPGIQFDDDPNAPNYIVQVLQPGDATTAGPTADPNDPIVWVRYELNRLSSIYQSSFTELPGPTPAVHFGGTLWQGGVARLTDNNTNIRVQIYATVYNGTPYIINLLATEDRFAGAVRAYFDPMLQSFTFLPPTTS